MTPSLSGNPCATSAWSPVSGSGYGPVIDKVTVESCLLVICLS